MRPFAKATTINTIDTDRAACPCSECATVETGRVNCHRTSGGESDQSLREISSNSGDYRQAEDGRLTVYIQHTSPGKDKESNWLATPKGEFLLAFRTYLPGKEIVEQVWQVPGLVKVN